MQDRPKSDFMVFFWQRLSSFLLWFDSLNYPGRKIFVTTAHIDEWAPAAVWCLAHDRSARAVH